jgi:hypothetical protein
MCTHVSKCKNDTCWNYSRNQQMGRRREEWWKRITEGLNSSIIYLMHCNNLCKCHNVPPPIAIINKYINKIKNKISLVFKPKKMKWLRYKSNKLFKTYVRKAIKFPWNNKKFIQVQKYSMFMYRKTYLVKMSVFPTCSTDLAQSQLKCQTVTLWLSTT